jgi:hypothetical protein
LYGALWFIQKCPIGSFSSPDGFLGIKLLIKI